DDAGDAVGRRARQRGVESREQLRALAGRGVALGGRRPFDLEVLDLAEALLELTADGGLLFGALVELLARALVDDDEGDVGEAVALLLAQRRVQEGGEEGGEGRAAPESAAASAEDEQGDERKRDDARRPDEGRGDQRRKLDRPAHAFSLLLTRSRPVSRAFL